MKTMTAKKNWCQYDCGREAEMVPHNGIHTTCKTCYMRVRYAVKKGTAWMIRRSRQVGSWQNSLSEQMGEVSQRRQKKRRRVA
jgi:hypothetical protein